MHDCLNTTLVMQAQHQIGAQQPLRQNLRRTAHQILKGKDSLHKDRTLLASAKQQQQAAARQLMLQSAPCIVQDMAAHIAEAVAVSYLAEARSGLTGRKPSDDFCC